MDSELPNRLKDQHVVANFMFFIFCQIHTIGKFTLLSSLFHLREQAKKEEGYILSNLSEMTM